MKRLLIAATAVLLLTASAQAGSGDYPTKPKISNGINETVLYNNDKTFWKVADFTYDNGNAEQCVLMTSWTERNDRKAITSCWYLKFNLDVGMHWAFAKQSWRMTAGNEVMSVLSVDGQTWSGKATVQSDRNAIATGFSNEHGTDFLVAMRKAKTLSIVFPSARAETPFIVKIDQKALAAFEECSSRLIADSGPDEAPEQEQEQKPDTSDANRDKFRGA